MKITAVLRAGFLATNPVALQLNTIVANTGDKLVLIDTGTGGKFQPSGGVLLRNLAAAGYAPDDIDTILFTHGHPDHLWGATDSANAAALFPNVEFVATGAEVDFWSAEELPGKVPAGMRQLVEVTQQNLKVIKANLRTIKPGAEVVPGITSVDTPGHTPGHVSVLIASNGEELLVTGDVIQNPAISFQKPDWPVGFDMDKAQGAKTRAAFLDRVATDKTLIASYHLPFPAVGHVVRDGTGYRWLPAEWHWAT
jgi:glyoxylase-like metal-dependent hydrolase (beta-lactamase superfamily II)